MGDRMAVGIIGVALMTAGAAGIAWYLNLGGYFYPYIYAPWIAELPWNSWWYPAVLALGVLLFFWGCSTLFSRLRRERVRELRLDGSDATGQLTTNPVKVAKIAAAELNDTMGVSSARGKALRFQGRNVIELRAEAVDVASLSQLKEAMHTTVSNTRIVLGDRAAVRVVVDVGANKAPTGPRVL